MIPRQVWDRVSKMPDTEQDLWYALYCLLNALAMTRDCSGDNAKEYMLNLEYRIDAARQVLLYD